MTLRSCFLSSFVELRLAVSEKKSKMWKFMPDGWRAMPIAHLNLKLRWARKKQINKKCAIVASSIYQPLKWKQENTRDLNLLLLYTPPPPHTHFKPAQLLSYLWSYPVSVHWYKSRLDHARQSVYGSFQIWKEVIYGSQIPCKESYCSYADYTDQKAK